MYRFVLTVFIFSFQILFGFGISHAGTIVVPSIFTLHRPLNPALITRSTGIGAAYGGGVGNRDLLNSAPSNCQLKRYSKCHDDVSDSRLIYGNVSELFYLQLENISIQKHEENKKSTYSLNFNQNENDALLSFGIKTEFISLGAYYRETDLKLREYYLDINGGFSSEYTAQTFTPGYGLNIDIGNFFHFALYKDGPTRPRSTNNQGRDFDLVNKQGFQGGGVGMRINIGDSSDRPDEINIEYFQLLTLSPITGDNATLSGIDFEITYFSLVFYSLILRDNKNNYFRGELLRDTDVSFATGVGYNGEFLQVLIGRDPRYFTGIDAGTQLVVGFQF